MVIDSRGIGFFRGVICKGRGGPKINIWIVNVFVVSQLAQDQTREEVKELPSQS